MCIKIKLSLSQLNNSKDGIKKRYFYVSVRVICVKVCSFSHFRLLITLASTMSKTKFVRS